MYCTVLHSGVFSCASHKLGLKTAKIGRTNHILVKFRPKNRKNDQNQIYVLETYDGCVEFNQKIVGI